MKSVSLSHKSHQSGEKPASFFPRIIREFDDGPDEKPMMYWRND